MAASDMRVIGRYQGNFSFGKVQTAAQNISLERDLVAYDTMDSTLAYVCKQGQDQPCVDGVDRITLNVIRKNESTIALNKLINEANSRIPQSKPIEIFAQLSIPFTRVTTRNLTPGTHYDD
jgi:hypothetical protein